MKQPLIKAAETDIGAANVPQPVTREDKAAARKAAKTEWNAGPVFPVAFDPALLGWGWFPPPCAPDRRSTLRWRSRKQAFQCSL